jgi:hypothetical protein
MLRQIDKSLRQTKPSRRFARALSAVMFAVSRSVPASAVAAVLLISSASADDKYKLLDWNWKFQKHPMASSFEYCSTNAPTDPKALPDPNAPPDKAKQSWSKVLETIQAAADKWKYSKKDPNKDPKANPTIFQFRIASGDCPRCPGLNYIEFGTLKDPTKPAETSNPRVSGTLPNMKKCAIRFNSAISWNVGEGDPKSDQFDLLSVALREFGHCVGLDDAPTGTAVMSPGLKPGEKRRDLQPDDIAGRNKIYGDP